MKFKRKNIVLWIYKLIQNNQKNSIFSELPEEDILIIDFIIASNFVKPIIPTPTTFDEDQDKTLEYLVYSFLNKRSDSTKINNNKIIIHSAVLTNDGLEYLNKWKTFAKKYTMSILSLVIALISVVVAIIAISLKQALILK